MKFLEEFNLEVVNQELNFEPHGANLVVRGGCDLFLTKLVLADQRLFKTIDAHLDQIIEDNELSKLFDHDRRNLFSLYGLSAGLARRGSVAERSRTGLMLRGLFGENEDDLPFGPLRGIYTRKTFSYLIGILNTTFPDHDFSTLQPTTENFHRISPEDLRQKFNNLLLLLGKRPEQLQWMWDTINVYMDFTPPLNSGLPRLAPQLQPGLRKNSLNAAAIDPCELPLGDIIQVYSFQPLDDLILEDMMYPHSTMWQNYWFVYNRKLKRVAFLYLAALNKLQYSNTDAMELTTNLVSGDEAEEEVIGDMEMEE